MSFPVTCQLAMPEVNHIPGYILANAAVARRMVQEGTHAGRSVTICGAGPSLATYADTGTDDVWACNSALPYLKRHRQRVTHGFCIDQGPAMLTEWRRTFAIPYYVASSVNPALVAHLVAHGRTLTFFHSYLGMPDPPDWTSPDGDSYEMHLYRRKFPTSVQVGYGLNSVPRAVCLALIMGYTAVRVVGADCACAPDAPPMPAYGTRAYTEWIDALVMYADGRTAGQCFGHEATMAEAVIDGVRWHTRADMVISAQHLLDLCATYQGRVWLEGHGLPLAFSRQGPEFFASLPKMTGAGAVDNFAREDA